jgi:nucleoside-diphosphate-sugar epimerase
MLLSSTEVESFASRLDLGVLQGKRVLITGGTGMVGSYLVESLCKGLEVQKIFPREIRVISGSGDFSSLKHLQSFKFLVFHEKKLLESHELGGFEFLIHAASPASPTKFSLPEVLWSINVNAFSKLITSATERALFISSGEVYGADAPIPVPENYLGAIDANLSRSAYALAKIEGELRGRELCVAQGAEFRVGRLFHTFGPGVRKNDGRSFADFLWQSAEGKKPILKSAGGDVRTFLYSLDAVVGLLQILLQDKHTNPINIGSEKPFTILDFATQISTQAGLFGETEMVVSADNYTHSPNHVIIPDTNRLKSLGWRQEIDLKESIDKTLAWIKAQNV